MAEKRKAKTDEEVSEDPVAKAPAVRAPIARAPMQNEGHFVFIGKKGAMAYVLAVITQFSQGANEVIIKARGKSISRAVDVAEIVRNKSTEIKLASIGISTEEVVTQDGRPLKVSAIEIKMTK